MAQAPKEFDFKTVDKLQKDGRKLLKGGMFSKKNPDDAEKKFEEAKKLLRRMKPASFESTKRLLSVLEDIAEAQSEMNLPNQAGKSMEEAARTAVNNKNVDVKGELMSKVPYYYQQASIHFLTHSEYERSCKMLLMAADHTCEIGQGSEESIANAIKLYDQSCAIEENEGRYQMCHEFFDAAIKFCINNSRFVNASEFLQRQIKQYDNDQEKFYQRIFRNVCSLMIIQFYLKDVKNAQKIYNEAIMKYQHLNNHCGQQQLCEKLLVVFENADAEGLETIQKSGDLGLFLMNTVSRLAKKLTMQDIQPMIIKSNEDLKKEKEQENEQIKDEAKEDVSDAQLASQAAETKLDDEGAPDLVS